MNFQTAMQLIHTSNFTIALIMNDWTIPLEVAFLASHDYMTCGKRTMRYLWGGCGSSGLFQCSLPPGFPVFQVGSSACPHT